MINKKTAPKAEPTVNAAAKTTETKTTETKTAAKPVETKPVETKVTEPKTVEPKAAPAEKKAAAPKKEAAPKKPAAKKPAVKKEIKSSVVIEYAGEQIVAKDILEAAKKAFTKLNKGVEIKTIEVYVKPEEHAAYYVVNGEGSDQYKVVL